MNKYSTPPAVSDFGDIAITTPPPIYLDNGIPLQVIGDGDDEVCSVTIYFLGGKYEQHIPSLAAITAGAIFEGNSAQTSEEIADTFDYCGASVQNNVYDHHTSISLMSLKYNFEQTLSTFVRCITSPSFPTDKIETIKRRIAAVCAVGLTQANIIADNEMNRLYYGDNHPHAAVTTPKEVLGITVDDITTFRKNYFGANNCRIIAAGMITDNEIKLINATIGQWDFSAAKSQKTLVALNSAVGTTSIVNKDDALQSSIIVKIPAIMRSHSDYHRLRTTVIALGGYFGSRLVKNIREEKGFTYGISAALIGRSDESSIEISTECDTSYTWQVLSEIKHEIKRLQTELMPQSELDVVKRYIKSSLAKALDTPFSRASHVALEITVNNPKNYFTNQLEVLNQITPQHVLNIACKYLSEDDMITVIAGDKPKIIQSQPELS